MRWTLIVEPKGRSGADNMGVDAALLRRAQEGGAFLRLYGWDPPCLSFGRNEPVTRRYDLDRLAARGLDVVRRPTGGRAVWHDREVTYAVAAPVRTFGSLRDAYREIHRVIAAGLRGLGLAPTLAPVPTSPRDADGRAGSCFASPAGGEIVVGGRKLVGSAQVRQHDALLQHGSILLEDRQDVVTEFLRGRSAPPASVALSDLLGEPVEMGTVTRALAGAAREAWGGTWEARDPFDAGPDAARFRDPAWTWRR